MPMDGINPIDMPTFRKKWKKIRLAKQ